MKEFNHDASDNPFAMARLRFFAFSFLCWTLLQAVAGAEQDTVLVFNEVMYHAADDAPESEWLELVSQMGVDIDISGWAIEGGVDYTFPEGTIVPGGAHIVVAADPNRFPGSFGPFEGQLSNSGEEIRLVNNSRRVMSIIEYGDGEFGDWPVAPDGSGVSLAKIDPDLLPTPFQSWSFSAQMGGTPGELNFPEGKPTPAIVFNEVAHPTEDAFWVELMNRSSSDVELEGYQIGFSAGDEAIVLPATLLTPGALLQVDLKALEWPLPTEGDRLFLLTPTGDQVLDALRIRVEASARFPDGAEAWYIPSEQSPNEPNVVFLETGIVINEIMYHHRPTYEDDSLGQVYEENPEEWIELYNLSDAPIDLSSWSFGGGLAFNFPVGTTLEADGYLVISNDPDLLGTKYPDITILGPLEGGLNNGSDPIILRDAVGNPVDEVVYHDGGRWPGDADGDGSSLELKDPRSDNSIAEAWAASDEAAKSEWHDYSYRGPAIRGMADPTQWREFVMGLLSGGEFLIDDLSVVEDPEGQARQFLRNGTFSRTIFGGDGTQNWRFLGNHGLHGETVVEGNPEDDTDTYLHVMASGPTEHMHNHIETTFPSGVRVTEGREYEISFRAKWLSGSPRLHTRLYFNYLAHTTILALPENHGTPGRVNSRFAPNVGPTFDGLIHSPVISEPNEAITVNVHASDPDGLGSINLIWAEDGEEFQSIAMTDNGEGDFSAQIPGHAAGTKLLFYVEGDDSVGAVSVYPPEGPDSRAMCIVNDGAALEGPGHHFRIVMTEADLNMMHEVTNVMSNHRIPATVIWKEETIYYNVGVRLKGSQRGRSKDVRAGFSVGFPSDNKFRGLHNTVSVDRSGAGDQYSQKEILVKHAVNRAGNIPGMMDDLIYVIAPRSAHTGSAILLMARYDDEFLDGQFENGSEGRLFEYELIYYPTSTTSGEEGLKRPEPDSVAGVPHTNLGDSKEFYRWHYLIDNNLREDDYSGLIPVLQAMGLPQGEEYQNRMGELLDVDQWLRSFAIQTLFGVGDSYASGSQHNMIIYLRPNDGKALYFPWDMDFTFSSAATSPISQNGDLNKLLANPVYLRSYYAQMYELLDSVFKTSYMERWVTHYSTFLPREDLSGFLSFINARNSSVSSQLRQQFPKVNFAITTEGGDDFTVNTPFVVLEGDGWYDVDRIRINDIEYHPEWLDRSTWQITVPLASGENLLELQALDYKGSEGSLFAPLGEDSITITNTGSVEPATAENLVISEIMYHPENSTPTEIEAGFQDENAFEFIEFANVGSAPIDVSALRFVEGIEFDFANSDIAQLAVGQRLIIVANLAAFQLRYGDDLPVAGTYTGQLSNSGERLAAESLGGVLLLDLTYSDSDPWPAAADGDGVSLVLVNETGGVDYADLTNWGTSQIDGGSPGRAETTDGDDFDEWLATRGGTALDDPDGDGIALWLEYVLGVDLSDEPESELLPIGTRVQVGDSIHGGFSYRLRDASAIEAQPEYSADLITWASDPGDESVILKEDTSPNGDGTSSVSVRLVAPILDDAPLFWRLRGVID